MNIFATRMIIFREMITGGKDMIKYPFGIKKNSYKILAISMLLCCCSITDIVSQNRQKIKISKSFNWTVSNPSDQSIFNEYNFSFDDREQREDQANLPVYLHEIPLDSWDEARDSVIISIVNDEFISTNETENNFLKKANINRYIWYNVIYAMKKPFLQIHILPFNKRLDNLNYQKLKTIELDVSIYTHPIKILKSSALSSATTSMLNDGKWLKIKITNTGVHKIPYTTLSSWGFSNPSEVNVFGYGGKMIPSKNSLPRGDDMVENATYHYNNAIYFYAQGTVEWSYNTSKKMFTHQTHDYSDAAYYFLSEKGDGLTIGNVDHSNLTATSVYNTYDDYQFHEINENIFIRSGRNWYGERFYNNNELVKEFDFPNIDTVTSVKISTEAIARSSVASSLSTYINNSSLALQKISFYGFNINNTESDYAIENSSTNTFQNKQSKINVKLVYNSPSAASIAYLDKINIQVKSKLVFNGTQFSFRNYEPTGVQLIGDYKIAQVGNANTLIWDVTNTTRPININKVNQGEIISFIYPVNQLVEYVIFSPEENLPVPTLVETVANQNLHGLPQVDYLIIANDNFISEAKRLAILHQTNSNLTTAVVTPQQIYNEFSSGQPDVTAIRMFAKMFYDRAGNNKALMPRYMLLFGDGSYNNRSTVKNSNYILTYQSLNSIHYTRSYVTDDYFGFLDVNEGSSETSDAIDLGIGRFPVQTMEQAKTAVDKVEYYMLNQTKSPWKTRIAFVGDDGDGNYHMTSSNNLAKKVEVTNPEFELSKIYFDAYKKVTLAAGKKYPDVEYAIEKSITDGVLIFNYMGHGGEKGLSHEQVITIEKIKSWTNINKLSLFITATCEFSRFDDKDFTSAGEEVFLNPKGGAFALFTTTRLVYSSLNFDINNKFYNHAFSRDSLGNKLRLGDILRQTKREAYNSINKLNFTLLGDPALQLCYPDKYIYPTEVNGFDISKPDTLKALSKATIKGMMNDKNFTGTSTTKLYDKPILIRTLGNEGNTPMEFVTYENVLYRGEAEITSGSITNTFIVPKDIKYNIGNGRISYYAQNENEEAFGAYNSIPIGGSSNIAIDSMDYEGPIIDLMINEQDLSNGGLVNTTPLLRANLWDKNGINASGNGIGHDITLSINGGAILYVLNNYFQSEKGSYQKGMVSFQLPTLKPGEHVLTFKAWDTYNNSSAVTIKMTVSNSGELLTSGIYTYPNPLNTTQSLNLEFEHNDPNSAINATIRLYNLSGQLLSQTKQLIFSAGTSTVPIEITPTLTNGKPLLAGIYIVKVHLESESGKIGSITEKIVVIE